MAPKVTTDSIVDFYLLRVSIKLDERLLLPKTRIYILRMAQSRLIRYPLGIAIMKSGNPAVVDKKVATNGRVMMILRTLFGLESLRKAAAVNTYVLGRTTRPDGLLLKIPLATEMHGGRKTLIIGQNSPDLSRQIKEGEGLLKESSPDHVGTVGTLLHLGLCQPRGVMVRHGRREEGATYQTTPIGQCLVQLETPGTSIEYDDATKRGLDTYLEQRVNA